MKKLQFWHALANKAYKSKLDQVIEFPKEGIPHPGKEKGVTKSGFPHALPKGQRADWRIPVKDASFHIHEYKDKYVAHVDIRDPHKEPVKHLFGDLPDAVTGALTLLGAGLPLALTKKRWPILVGALGGWGLGTTLVHKKGKEKLIRESRKKLLESRLKDEGRRRLRKAALLQRAMRLI